MADQGDVQTLARKLRAKGLSDDQVIDGLRGMGFTKAQAEQAAAATSTASASTGAPRAGAGTAPRPRPRTAARRAPRRTPPAPTSRSGPAAPPTGSDGSGGGRLGLPSLSPPSVPSLPSLTLTPPRRLSGGDLGGFAAGLFVYVLALNYLRSGPEGVSAWFKAKFLNEPDATLGVPAPTTTTAPEVRPDQIPRDRNPFAGPRRGGPQPTG